jgi:hypothetical protein
MAENPKASDPRDRGEDDASKDPDDWESDWNDYGELPTFIPDFNVSLSDFIIKNGGVKTSFPEIFRLEGGYVHLSASEKYSLLRSRRYLIYWEDVYPPSTRRTSSHALHSRCSLRTMTSWGLMEFLNAQTSSSKNG